MNRKTPCPSAFTKLPSKPALLTVALMAIVTLIFAAAWPVEAFAADAGADASYAADGDHGHTAKTNTAMDNLINLVVNIGMVITCGCITLSLIRILLGPTTADRVLAADAMTLFVVALVILLGIELQTSVFFDAALLVAIIGFVSTIAFSRFLQATRALPPQPDLDPNLEHTDASGITMETSGGAA